MSRSKIINPASEDDVIMNSTSGYLYNHEFEKGRFFQVVHADGDGFSIKTATKTMLKAVYIKDKEDIEGIEFIKMIGSSEKQRIKLSKFNLIQIKTFLKFLNETPLKDIEERKIKLIEANELDEDTVKTIRELLSKDGGGSVIETLLNEGVISSKDLVNTAYRLNELKTFERLLRNTRFLQFYAQAESISVSSEEKVWQYFFNKNPWIFGYGLDYRYLKILQKEANLSEAEIDGTNSVVADFLMADSRFTTFVELKKPTTPLFGKSKNRSNSWKLSNDLIDSVSQILEHKAAGQIKLDKTHYVEGQPVAQKAFDPKVILIIGNWSELGESATPLEQEIKKKTFEIFRRDSKNIEILTFDELYERAKFIAVGDEANDELAPFDEEDDDFPF